MPEQEFSKGQVTEGKAEDARSVLSEWYGNNAIYVDTLEKNERVRGKSGTGRMILSNGRIEIIDPSCVDNVSIQSETEATGILKVTDGHTFGHFNNDSGLPSIFPGHKQIRAALEAVREAEKLRSENNNAGAVLWSFDGVKFQEIVRPGNVLEINVKEIKRNGKITWQDVEIKRGSRVVAAISNMIVELTDGRDGRETDNAEFFEDQLIEAAGQTAGLTSSLFGEGDFMPFFQSIGSTKFYKRPKVGAGISIVTEVATNSKRGFEAFATIKANGERIGQIDRLRVTAVPLNVARWLLRG